MRGTRYAQDDTVVAVSSPSSGQRVIVRVSGADTVQVVNCIFEPPVEVEQPTLSRQGVIYRGTVAIDSELRVDAKLYLFLAPYSYTGDDVAEIHIHSNPSVTEFLMDRLLSEGVRMAGPGEFTARAYLNGKVDLSQAEAVNEVIISSNKLQLAAAEELLVGRLGETVSVVRSSIVECLSLIEAGLDFSQQDIELISIEEAVERLEEIRGELERLLAGSIGYESVVDLPSVGIAGAVNAGKSSLLNGLVGRERSIVSERRKTTRDVLAGLLELERCECVLFDCAGLMCEPCGVLDELAQQAAVEALRRALVVVFCVDVSKTDWAEDVAIRELVGSEVMLVATKSDLLSEDELVGRLSELKGFFGDDFLVVSIEAGTGLELLGERIEGKIIEQTVGSVKPAKGALIEPAGSEVALTARHKRAVAGAIGDIDEAVGELRAGNDEVASMVLRAAYEAISGIESAAGGHIDEQVLERIFQNFCIGK